MSEHFSLQWDNFHKNMSAGMQSLLESEDLVDVTLAVEGRHLKAHKMVLSLCSPYFRQLFQSSPCKHPIVFMKDVSYIALSDLLQFMYQGEVQVAQENLPTFIKTAEALQIKGLTGDSTNQNEEQTDIKSTNETNKRTAEVLVASPVQSVQRVKKYTGPASKRVRVRSPSPSSSAATPVVPAEVAVETDTSTVASNVENAILMKMEPNDNIEASVVKEVTEQSQDSYVDESLVEEDAEDYTLMETNEDDPKPGTSFDGIGESQEENWQIHSQISEMELFYTQLSEYYRNTSGKTPYTRVEIASMIEEILSAKSKMVTKTRREYWLLNQYDVLEVAECKYLIKKCKNYNSKVIYVVPYEDLYSKLLEIHVAVGHGARDKMSKEASNKYKITRPCIQIFLKYCKICKKKQSRNHFS